MELYELLFMLVAVVSLTLYAVTIVIKYGVQTSLSRSFYTIEENSKNPNNKWWFSLALLLFAFPMIVIGVEVTPLFFLAGAAVLFVAAAPAFKSTKLQHDVHIAGAVIGGAASLLAFITAASARSGGESIILWATAFLLAAGMGALKLYKVKNLTWWVEGVIFYVSWLGLFILKFVENA